MSVGDSMAPRLTAPGFCSMSIPFKAGQARTNGVVVFQRNNAVLIKEFVELTKTHLGAAPSSTPSGSSSCPAR